MKRASEGRSVLGSQRGAVMPLVGFLIIAMLALAAFAVDIGYILVTRQQLQNAADACVLAAAPAMILEEPVRTSEVEARVLDMASRHSAGNDESVYVVPDEDIVILDKKLTVYTRKLRSRGNGLPLFFAKILRIQFADVQAKAAVVMVPTSSACCVKPWSVPDRWADEAAVPGYPTWQNNGRWDGEPFEDSNGNRLYDSGEEFTDANGNGVYDSEHYDRALSQANEEGYIPSLPPDGHIGMEVKLKLSSKDNRPAQSYFNPIVLPWPGDESHPQWGAAYYRESIAKCNPLVLEPDTELQIASEPGRMTGPTIQGTTVLLEQDPTAYWNEEIQNVDHTGDGSIGESPRIIVIPVFDPRMWPESGRLMEKRGNAIVVAKMVAFFIERLDKDVITARVTRTPVSCLGGSEPGGEESFTWTPQLVE